MAMVAHASHVAHRKAFGPGTHRSAATKARHVAESILLHEAEGHSWTLAQYGLDVESPQWYRVLETLGTLRQAQHAAAQEV
jgi:hypothetical protein